jgi:hypothetical protein
MNEKFTEIIEIGCQNDVINVFVKAQFLKQ